MKTLELQITQTRHPKSVADGQSGPITRTAFAKATQVKILMMNQFSTHRHLSLV